MAGMVAGERNHRLFVQTVHSHEATQSREPSSAHVPFMLSARRTATAHALVVTNGMLNGECLKKLPSLRYRPEAVMPESRC